MRTLSAALALLLGFAFGMPTPASADDRGKALFDVCAQCHGADGAGNAMFLAPAIAGLSEWYVAAQLRKYRAGIRGKHFDDVAGLRMRPMSMTIPSDEDVDPLAAYVASLPSVNPEPILLGGDPEKGKASYVLCSSCHGEDAQGMQALFAPRLTNTNDWYLAEQLRKFKSRIRAGDPADATGMLMYPMSMTLTDDQMIKDVLAYIQTLSK